MPRRLFSPRQKIRQHRRSNWPPPYSRRATQTYPPAASTALRS